MKLFPYALPLIPEYRAGVFKKATRRLKPVVETLLFRENDFYKRLQDVWVSYYPCSKRKSGQSRNKQGTPHWTPKLYICPGANAYWPLILRLVKKFRRAKHQWKFFMAPHGYERPDKIVFYFDSGAQLKRFVGTLRPLLPRSGFHDLRHAASTAQMGIEAEGLRGLYVGMDPPIGKSWRIYRCFCLAWADQNMRAIETLPGGKKRWFERMNLSLVHEGPYSLSTDPDNFLYIRRFWRMIDPDR